MDALKQAAFLPCRLRHEIEEVVRDPIADGRFDDAIFAAFRRVESALQTQSGLPNEIGNGLVASAIGGPTPRLRISPNPQDAQRLVELFRGALGFLKGDRSHKDAPAVPCPDKDSCLRALALASFLLDLIDLDENTAPQIRGVRAEGDSAVELETLRTGPGTEVFVDGQLVAITSRNVDVIRVDLPSQAQTVEIRLVDGRRRSLPFKFTRPMHGEPDNFHVVDAIDVAVYDSATGGSLRPYKAVRLRSYETGRSFTRCFPAGRSFAVGEYVTWDWHLDKVSAESWLDHPSGRREYGWGSSAFFAGRRVAMSGTPELVAIQVRPREVRLRPGDRAPIRVIGTYRDGPARWNEDVTERADIESLDPDVLLVTDKVAVHAKRSGRTQLRARLAPHFSSASVNVAALSQGAVVEWLGGYLRTSGLLDHPDGLLISHQSDHLLAVRASMKVEAVARLEVPDTAPTGIDMFAANPQGDLYVRALWNREVVEVPHASGFSRSTRIAVPNSGAVAMALAWSTQLDGLLIGDSAGQIHLWRKGAEAELWARLPFGIIGLYPTDDAVLVLPGGGRVPGYGRLDWADRRLTMVPLSLPVFGSALLPRDQDILLASFNDGRVYSVSKVDGHVELFAEGFTNPSALARDKHGSVFVANFGGDSISRVLP